MAVRLTTTAESSEFCKILIHGASGVGKTKLGETTDSPIYISTESGLLSVKKNKYPVIKIDNHIDLEEAYDIVTTDPRAMKRKTIILDSITDMAQVTLAYFKENPVDGNTHPQAAYGQLADSLLPLIKKFRDIPDRHVYFIARTKYEKDEFSGITSWVPSMPGQVLLQALPYEFDLVLAMRVGQNEEGEDYRYLQTKSCIQYLAKDRSGKLDEQEEPDLKKLFKKALG